MICIQATSLIHPHILGYPDLYLMKLVNSHVITVDGVGEVIENFMMYNHRPDSVPYGPCSKSKTKNT